MQNEAILESISDGVFTVDLEWRVTYFNRAAERITGIRRKDAVGRLCSEVFRSSMCESNCPIRKTLETGKPVIGRACFIIDARGERVPISVSTAVLRDSKGRIRGGAETFRDLSEIEALRQELEGRARLGDLVSHSPVMRRIFEVLPAIAESPSTVLVVGETGTGKELVAKAIHSNSTRSRGPFIAVNCGALPDQLLESELFGYRAGAFTGADRDKPGRFAAAEGGSLFLDEVSEVSPALQVKLLRVLQEREYEPLGSNSPVKADVRVIAATNRDLAAEVASGRMREDFYYRINVVRIEIPPLRSRKEDIPLLVDRFIEKFNALHGKSIEGMEPEALSLLMAHDWPGNVRELENFIERAFILCRRKTIGVECLTGVCDPGARSNRPEGIRDSRGRFEAGVVQTALERNGWRMEDTARDLGIHRTTLYRRMKRLGIEKPGGARPARR
ncbi:sigma 54-interacting transcriptional regulator [Candidatus Fermentibacteria bacterium]|nr:sigma 54-interacting transcriptional regulator [Candidatus Fermentibacteria bacterium]